MTNSKYRIILLAVFLLLLAGCYEKKQIYIDEISSSLTFNPVKVVDYLTYGSKKIYLNSISKFVTLDANNFAMYSSNDKKLIFTDSLFSVTKVIDLQSELAEHRSEEPTGLFNYKNTLLAPLDLRHVIKIDPVTQNKRSIILDSNCFLSSPHYLTVLRNGNMIFTYSTFTYEKIKSAFGSDQFEKYFAETNQELYSHLKKGDAVCGSEFTSAGKFVKYLYVPVEKLGHNFTSAETAYIAVLENNLYLFFGISQNVFYLDDTYNIKGEYSLAVQRELGPAVSENSKYYPFCEQPPSAYNNMLLHISASNQNTVLYNKEGKAVRRIFFEGFDAPVYFNYHICGSKLYLFGSNSSEFNKDNSIYVFNLTGLN